MELKSLDYKIDQLVVSFQVYQKSRLYIINERRHKTTVTWDSLETFKIQNTVEGLTIQLPTYVNFDLYKVLKKEQQKQNIRAKLIQEGKTNNKTEKGC